MPAPVSTAMASGGDHLGQNSTMARGHLRTPQESQENGNTAGSIRRLPFLTGTSGRQPCCQYVPPRLEFTYGHTQVSTQALPWLRQLLSLERLQLPLPVGEAVCSGRHAPLDPLGRHRAACARTGRLKRATSIERMLVRVCREGGTHVLEGHECGCQGLG